MGGRWSAVVIKVSEIPSSSGNSTWELGRDGGSFQVAKDASMAASSQSGECWGQLRYEKSASSGSLPDSGSDSSSSGSHGLAWLGIPSSFVQLSHFVILLSTLASILHLFSLTINTHTHTWLCFLLILDSCKYGYLTCREHCLEPQSILTHPGLQAAAITVWKTWALTFAVWPTQLLVVFFWFSQIQSASNNLATLFQLHTVALQLQL